MSVKLTNAFLRHHYMRRQQKRRSTPINLSLLGNFETGPPGYKPWETLVLIASLWYLMPLVSIFTQQSRDQPWGSYAAGRNLIGEGGGFDHASSPKLWKVALFILPLLKTREYIKINHRWRWFAIDTKCIMAGKRNLIRWMLPTTTCHSEMYKKPQLHGPMFPFYSCHDRRSNVHCLAENSQPRA